MVEVFLFVIFVSPIVWGVMCGIGKLLSLLFGVGGFLSKYFLFQVAFCATCIYAGFGLLNVVPLWTVQDVLFFLHFVWSAGIVAPLAWLWSLVDKAADILGFIYYKMGTL